MVVRLSSPGQSAWQAHLTSMAELLATPSAFRAGTGTSVPLSSPGQSVWRAHLTSMAERLSMPSACRAGTRTAVRLSSLGWRTHLTSMAEWRATTATCDKPGVAEPPKLTLYYCINHSFWSLRNNTELTCRLYLVKPVTHL
jgi:hypothetical protein